MEVLYMLKLISIIINYYIISFLIKINIVHVYGVILKKNNFNLKTLNSRILPSCYIGSKYQYPEKTNCKLRSHNPLKILESDELLAETDVYRGMLENGLKYSFYKKKMKNIETYLEVCSGSTDEMDDQRGLAHLCEHILFMGSNKRRKLNHYGVRTNACTDYNHTLFYVITDSNLGCNKRVETLKMMLEPLYDVLEAPTQFSQYELDKERKAVYSEARIITTAEYYKNCNAIKILHNENMLPKRYPIGDLEMMKSYTVEDAKKFHDQHYIPDNSHIFIQGDLDEYEVESVVKQTFSKLQNPLTLKEIQSLYKDTEKSRRKGMPAIKNVYGQKGKFNIQIKVTFIDPGFHVWSCDRLSSFSFEIMRKMAVPGLRTVSDYYKDTLNRLLYKIININFSIIKRDLQLYKQVTGNFYDCINEGCRVHSLDIRCDENDWKNSIFYVIAEVGRFLNDNISKVYLDYAKESLLFDFDTLDDEKESTNRFIENEICNRVNLTLEQHKNLIKRSYDDIYPETVREGMNRIFSWYKNDLTDVKVFATSLSPDLSVDDVKDVFYESINKKIKFDGTQIDIPDKLLSQNQVEDIISRSNSRIWPPMDKNFHLKTFKEEQYMSQIPKSRRSLFKEYYGKFKEYLNEVKNVGLYEPMPNNDTPDYEKFLEQQFGCSPHTKQDLKYVYSLINSPMTAMRTKPCKLYQNNIKYGKDETNKSDVVVASEIRNDTNETTSVDNSSHSEDRNSSISEEPLANKNDYVNSWTDGYTSYTLNNNVKVNCKLVEDDAIHVSANIPVVEYLLNNNFGSGSESALRTKDQKIKINKILLMLISGSLMESGSIGNLDRRQVELFCELNSIMVDISLSADYLNMNFEIPSPPEKEETRKNLLEYCLQMINMLLEKHQIKIDEFERAKKKLINDDQEYKNSIKDYGYGELVHSMTGGTASFHNIDLKRVEEIKYEDVVEEAKKLFSRTPKEINIVTNVNKDDLHNLVWKYLSSSEIISKSGGTFDDEHETSISMSSDGDQDQVVEGEQSDQISDEYYRKNRVTLFEDVTDKAIVFVGGHAPNSSGFLSDGKHMSTLLEETFKATAEDPEGLDDVCTLRRELWMHPAFPKAAGDLFMQVLDSDLFINLRTIKNLTYEASINVVTNDINDSYFVISSYCNSKNYPVVLSEILRYLKSLSNMEQQLSQANLDRCKRVIKNRIRESGSHYYFKNMTGIQLAEATSKNVLSLLEYEEVLDKITQQDFGLLMASQVYGIDEHNLYTRALYSNSN